MLGLGLTLGQREIRVRVKLIVMPLGRAVVMGAMNRAMVVLMVRLGDPAGLAKARLRERGTDHRLGIAIFNVTNHVTLLLNHYFQVSLSPSSWRESIVKKQQYLHSATRRREPVAHIQRRHYAPPLKSG